MPGANVTISADTISLAANDTIDTTLSGGASGSITLGAIFPTSSPNFFSLNGIMLLQPGQNVTLNSGSALNAGALGTGGTAGAVTVKVADIAIRPPLLPIDYSQKVVNVSLQSATITGGDVLITATASDPTPPGLLGEAENYEGDLGPLLNKVNVRGSAGFPGVNATVIIRGADAHVLVNNSTITSTGAVTLSGTTDVVSNGSATAIISENGNQTVSAAAGVGEASSTVDAKVTGTSKIQAAGDIKISASGTTDVKIAATALANINGKVKTNASTIAIAVASTSLTVNALIDNGATVTSTGGSVNVNALGSSAERPSATTAEDVQGFAGASASFAFETAHVNATVYGTVNAAGNVVQANSFNGSDQTAVIKSTNTFHIPNSGLTSGEAVVYNVPTGSTAIGGLTAGTTYYVLIADATKPDDFQLSTTPPLSLSPAGTDPNAKQTLTETNTALFLLDAIDSSQNRIYLPGSRFDDGDPVRYTANANATINGLANGGVAISGSVGVNVYNNTSHATVGSGARINQNTASQTAAQSVVISAATTMEIVDLAGIFKLGVSLSGLFGQYTQSKTSLSDKGNKIFDPGGRGGADSLGGSIMVTSINDGTIAIVAAGAMIRIGPAGSLGVTADESITRVEMAQSGSATGSGGKYAFAGSAVGYRQRSTTIAEIDSGSAPPAAGKPQTTTGASVTGGGAVTVKATTEGPQIAIAGAIDSTGPGATGIGVSVLVNDILRDTSASIGTDAANLAGTPTDATAGASGPTATPAGFSTITASTLQVTANTGGDIIGIGVAGTFLSGQKAPSTPDTTVSDAAKPEAATDAGSVPKSSTTSGIGIAGSALVNLVTDDTSAYINPIGTVTATSLTVAAGNDQNNALFSGGVAISIKAPAGTQSKTIAGAFALNNINDTTGAYAENAVFKITGAGSAAAPSFSVTAGGDGNADAFTAALAADTTASGKDFAGSMSLGLVNDNITATISQATVAQAAAVKVAAANNEVITSIGGGVAGSVGVGFGASIGYNQIGGNTSASVEGGSLQIGSLSVTAADNDLITAIGISAGASTGSAAAAFTMGINILATNANVFPEQAATNGDADGITAAIGGSAVVNASGAITVSADDNSVIQSIAGAFVIGTSASAFGIGLAWNEVVLNVAASVSGLVTGSSVSITSKSEQDVGLIGAKILSAAVGGAVSTSGDNTIGASVVVNGVQNDISAEITGGTVTATAGDIVVSATDEATIDNLVGGAAIAVKGSGFGAAIGLNHISNTVHAEINGNAISSFGSVTAQSNETATISARVFGLAGGKSDAVASSIAGGSISDHVSALVGDNVTVTAAGMVSALAVDTLGISVIAGQLAIGKGFGVGASIVGGTLQNTNTAKISGTARVRGTGGVTVNAKTDEKVSIIAIGGAWSQGVAASGSATITLVDESTTASIGDASSAAAA